MHTGLQFVGAWTEDDATRFATGDWLKDLESEFGD